MLLALETIEHIASYIPSYATLAALLDVLPERTPAMQHVRTWGQGIRGTLSRCTFSGLTMSLDGYHLRYYNTDAAPIVAYLAAAAPFVPRVSVTISNLAEWLRYVDAISHLVTSVELAPMIDFIDAAQSPPNAGATLRDALIACPRLHALRVTYTDWDDFDGDFANIDAVLAGMAYLPRLVNVDIDGCAFAVSQLATSSVNGLIAWLARCPAKSLRLVHCNLAMHDDGRDGLGPALASAISQSRTLEELEIKNVPYINSFGLDGQPLPSTLRVFRWTNSDTPRDESSESLARTLCTSLTSATRLERLRLAANSALCPVTFINQLAAVLPSMTHLTCLQLKGIGISDATPLVEVLPSLPALSTLRFKMALIEDLGAMALSAALPHCTALRALELRGVYNESSAMALRTAVQSMPTDWLYRQF
ncbi:hypothetical protein SPRG_14718 [Saprolegnia parasitica CBS 223.65]|uniref:F-box domain-containing protein n=1 Tax=Saprolegnia parasitica (strain CBS 223.65) TaxID=695850 RepID=A0A067BLJ6_SAPPC|nr:hypothetical protein SPRG_14718 [Saprolegnia parasitica CBS 223.65]KDO19083.1 hypothetical protein SPRG_14718 [Saprolegnia parasitica CBS 223.65]|eukprot:XP_012210210.1 hypothetical protein SPRG_14718 [Saprolegnia parasitica CBS 223.65]